jgi:oligoribonuclease (3'-5' exoribonuclease)
MARRVCCIDIETTGLNVDACQMIEFAAVTIDLDTGKRQTGSFTVQTNDKTLWEASAREMHSHRIEALKLFPTLTRSHVCIDFAWSQVVDILTAQKWLIMSAKPAIVVCGKNIGKFDFQFLRRLPRFTNIFHHRFIDIASLYFDGVDATPKSLYEIAAHNGLKPPTKEQRTAAYDAGLCAELLYKRLSTPPATPIMGERQDTAGNRYMERAGERYYRLPLDIRVDRIG